MNILVLGGTKFFGVHMVNDLLEKGHKVTIATRGLYPDTVGNKVARIIFNRTNPDSIKLALKDKHFDLVYDKIAYSSNDIKYLLDVLDCDKYIYMSTTAVYESKRINTIEEDFNPLEYKYMWCSRPDFAYEVVKRNAESALFQEYNNFNITSVRYPYVIGEDDYTKRLYFYVEHIIKGMSMYIDNLNCQMSYINSKEAGLFMSFLADKDFKGSINGCSSGTISLEQVIGYVEKKTGKNAILEDVADIAPYNGEVEYSINTDKARILGFEFSDINDWIYELLDYYIDLVNC